MATSRRRFLRRWGGRAVGLSITGLGLYVVAPSLITMFSAWPQLAEVDAPWFFILAGLQLGRLLSLWWLTRLALAPAHGVAAEPAGQDAHYAIAPRVGWGTTATAQLAGSAAAKILPGGGAAGGVVQAKILIDAGQPASSVGSGLGAIALLNNAVLFLLPVLTIP